MPNFSDEQLYELQEGRRRSELLGRVEDAKRVFDGTRVTAAVVWLLENGFEPVFVSIPVGEGLEASDYAFIFDGGEWVCEPEGFETESVFLRIDLATQDLVAETVRLANALAAKGFVVVDNHEDASHDGKWVAIYGSFHPGRANEAARIEVVGLNDLSIVHVEELSLERRAKWNEALRDFRCGPHCRAKHPQKHNLPFCSLHFSI